MRSRFVSAVAMASALVAFAGVGSVLAWRTNGWNLPTGQKLRVATAPLNDGGKKFFAALKEEMAAQRTDPRIVRAMWTMDTTLHSTARRSWPSVDMMRASRTTKTPNLTSG